MAQDKELEIQLQFLDEAQEYLNTIEAAILGLANSGVDSQKINAALRAAHSIKGGAAMMGFHILSQLAHRLEDSFKVLKVQRNSIALDADLERLLLAGNDGLRRVIDDNRQRREINPQWLESQIHPIFEQLHDRLGDPQAEDANSVLSPEDGQDIIPLLFETEVEGCLQRLEAVLQSGDPCLREEVEILAQELGGLGEMLQLSAFTQLAESVLHHMAIAADRVEDVAQAALNAWRHSQALVLTGNFSAMPAAISVNGLIVSPATESIATPISEEAKFEVAEFEAAEFEEVTCKATEFEAAGFEAAEFEAAEFEESEFEESEFEESEFEKSEFEQSGFEEITLEAATFETHNDGFSDDQFEIISTVDHESIHPVHAHSSAIESDTQFIHAVAPVSQNREGVRVAGQSAKFHIAGDASETVILDENPDNTVRVPIKYLNHMNDLMGELTIERNRLDLHLKRLRSLIRTLGLRVQFLEQSNSQLRTTYDRVSIQSDNSNNPLLSTTVANLSPSTPSIFEEDSNPNQFNDTFDALELDRYNDLHLMSQEVMETIVQVQEVTSDVELGLDDTEQVNRDLYKTTKQLQNSLSQVRMRPLSDIVDRFPKAIRELSLQHNKPVQLKIHGGHTLVDRNILEALSDPLLHLIRNAFDHGIEPPERRKANGKPEQGLIEIRAFHRHNRTIITISDDGGGIPLDKVRKRASQMGLDEMLLAAASDEELLSLIFEPGFSTTDRVTDLSGRGIGMDVVRNNLKQVRGEITVNTQAGVGTTFTLSVPFTLSVARVLLAESGGMLLAFPTDVIEEMSVLQLEQITITAGSEVLHWQDGMLPLVRLSQWLRFNCPRHMEGLETPPTITEPAVLILNPGNHKVGVIIDRCWGEQEVALRKVEGNLPLPSGFNSCTILGDGRVVPLVNVSEMLHWIASCDRSAPPIINTPNINAPTINSPNINNPTIFSVPVHLRPHTPPPPALLPVRKPTILVVDDSINVRRLLALTLEKAGYQVAQAKDGQDALDKLSAGLRVQAVICDIEMPRLDGYGFLARVKSTPDFDQLPVAMLTSRSGDKHRQLAMNLGATAYFSKPYNEQVLLQTLEKLIELAPAS